MAVLFLFFLKGVQVSARSHYEKILPLISDGKLLNENLAKLECLGGKKQLKEILEKESDIAVTVLGHMKKRDRRSSSNMSKTRAMVLLILSSR